MLIPDAHPVKSAEVLKISIYPETADKTHL